MLRATAQILASKRSSPLLSQWKFPLQVYGLQYRSLLEDCLSKYDFFRGGAKGSSSKCAEGRHPLLPRRRSRDARRPLAKPVAAAACFARFPAIEATSREARELPPFALTINRPAEQRSPPERTNSAALNSGE
ncbi:hypothetical protein MRX96_005335 [Rhipicephalus microplus]